MAEVANRSAIIAGPGTLDAAYPPLTLAAAAARVAEECLEEQATLNYWGGRRCVQSSMSQQVWQTRLNAS